MALLGSVAAVTALVLSSTGSYRVVAVFENAGQVVAGNEVKVGSIRAGMVEKIRLGRDNRAELVLDMDPDFRPLRRGTRAIVRSTSLAGIANRYVSLTPGPENATEIPDGGRIETEDTTSAVDLDQVLNSLDPRTTSALRDVVRASATGLRGRASELDAALESLNPALSASSDALHELARDEHALERLIVSSAGVVTTLAERRDDISSGTVAASAAAGAIAREREALAETLALAPATLRGANTALVNVRATLQDLRPAIGEARPVARRLSQVVPRLRPVAVALGREIPRLRRVISAPGAGNDLLELLASLPRLHQTGTPVVRDLVAALSDLEPVVRDARAYAPDVTGGLVAGFGGSSAGYYDANGHYARIGVITGPFSTNNSGSLVPRPPSEWGTGFRSGAVKRCPGGAVYSAPDGSNPFTDGGRLDCDPSLTRSGP